MMIIKTKKAKEIVDITEEINRQIRKKGLEHGLCNLFLKHTTAAITTADLDPGMDLDMLDAFEAVMPKLGYRHPHNPAHVTEHIMATLVGTSLSIPIENGKLILGTWQRVVLVELAGPREREVVVSFVKDG